MYNDIIYFKFNKRLDNDNIILIFFNKWNYILGNDK